jgi:HSP20 family protein
MAAKDPEPASEGWPWYELEVMMEHVFRAPRHRRPRHVWHPRVDLIEEADSLTVLAELPGVEADDVDVTLTGRVLRIRGEREFREPSSQHRCLITERPYGPFERRIIMPVPVDPNRITATCKAGVLIVKIPKLRNW